MFCKFAKRQEGVYQLMVGELMTLFGFSGDPMEVNNIGSRGDELSPISTSYCDSVFGGPLVISLVTHGHEVI